MRYNRIVYGLLSIGAIGAFFGHGMWAVDGKKSFVDLFAGTLDHALGVEVSTSTATNWVKGIGWFDLTVSAALVVMLIGVILGRGALYRFAFSSVAIAIYAWGAVWGFLTAGSRVTAVGDFYPEVWDVVERAPNFMIFAALIYLVYHHRLDHRPTAMTTENVAPGKTVSK